MSHRHNQIIHKALAVVRPRFRLDFTCGIHGIAHWSRVWIHGRALAAALDVNPDVLTWFAYLHDSQRHNDHRDQQHGSRAADFALQLRREGVISELDDQEFEQLCEAMRLHSDGHTVGQTLVLACWDADRLDLSRAGIEPDPARLCTAPAREAARIEAAVRMAGGMSRRPAFSRGIDNSNPNPVGRVSSA